MCSGHNGEWVGIWEGNLYLTMYAMRDAVTFMFPYKREKQNPNDNSSLGMSCTKSRKKRKSFLLR